MRGGTISAHLLEEVRRETWKNSCSKEDVHKKGGQKEIEWEFGRGGSEIINPKERDEAS